MYFHVCETQRTRMHVTDTTATLNGHQMAVVTWDRSILVAYAQRLPKLVAKILATKFGFVPDCCDHNHLSFITDLHDLGFGF